MVKERVNNWYKLGKYCGEYAYGWRAVHRRSGEGIG